MSGRQAKRARRAARRPQLPPAIADHLEQVGPRDMRGWRRGPLGPGPREVVQLLRARLSRVDRS